MEIHIAKSPNERIVIVGGGFGGLKLATMLAKQKYQVVLIDRNNFHQFQPLFYQFATSGLEPSSIIFPYRKIFQRQKQFHFRMAEVEQIVPEQNEIITSIGTLSYDHLIIASGARNNFFGNQEIEKHTLPMKSINESLRLRNIILERFEESLSVEKSEQQAYLNFVIAGAGPTGVELAGTLAEMKRFVLPKDYPELDFKLMKIILIEGSDRVLSTMHLDSSHKALTYLQQLGVEVQLSTLVRNYDGKTIELSTHESISCKTLIWAAGIQANFIQGLPEAAKTRGNRISVDRFNVVLGSENIYAIGDVACIVGDEQYPNGHPQLAQAAIQQGKNVAKNFKNKLTGKERTPFQYKNLGSMATIGRNKAVVELPSYKFSGFFAWLVWMLVHLRSILGIRNKWIVFMNWVWNYFTYNLSLRLIIKRKDG
jgi:NADH:ubiquinone reductase (H+-translocating)